MAIKGVKFIKYKKKKWHTFGTTIITAFIGV